MRKLGSHARAVFVAFHLVAITLMALPSPQGGMRKSAWKDPTVQSEIQAWADRLGRFGLDMEAGDLEDRLWQFASRYEALRGVVLAPFRPYYTYLGCAQSWKMFVAPHRFPARLVIDLKEDGEWREVYRARDDDHQWLAPVLDHDRMRSAVFRFGWRAYRRSYRQFADWVATQARHDFPEATHIRLRFHRRPTPSAAAMRAGDVPEGRYTDPQQRTLALEESP